MFVIRRSYATFDVFFNFSNKEKPHKKYRLKNENKLCIYFMRLFKK